MLALRELAAVTDQTIHSHTNEEEKDHTQGYKMTFSVRNADLNNLRSSEEVLYPYLQKSSFQESEKQSAINEPTPGFLSKEGSSTEGSIEREPRRFATEFPTTQIHAKDDRS